MIMMVGSSKRDPLLSFINKEPTIMTIQYIETRMKQCGEQEHAGTGTATLIKVHAQYLYAVPCVLCSSVRTFSGTHMLTNGIKSEMDALYFSFSYATFRPLRLSNCDWLLLTTIQTKDTRRRRYCRRPKDTSRSTQSRSVDHGVGDHCLPSTHSLIQKQKRSRTRTLRNGPVMPCPGLTSIFDPRSVRPSSSSFVLFGGRFTKEDGASGQAHPSPGVKNGSFFLRHELPWFRQASIPAWPIII